MSLVVNPVGKPDASNPHVRFDERGWETGRRSASALAPILDSTRANGPVPGPVRVSGAGARRRILHFGVTAHPTAEWTAQQLREAFPWDSAPRYLLRDRDQIFGKDFVDQVKALGIKQVLSAPRSPWQRAHVERLIGSIRRECIDHVIVFGERSLHRTLTAYCTYYHRWRTHLSLGKDAPQSRRIQAPAEGTVVELREVGGLHHHYERRAA